MRNRAIESVEEMTRFAEGKGETKKPDRVSKDSNDMHRQTLMTMQERQSKRVRQRKTN